VNDKQIEPITVTPKEGGRYQLVAGERRWRAAQLANLPNIEAVVKSGLSQGKTRILQLVENMQREDLTDYEVALTLLEIKEESPEALSLRDLGQLCNRTKGWAHRVMSMLETPWRGLCEEGVINSAATLERFRALPEASRDLLIRLARAEQRPVNNRDIVKSVKAADANIVDLVIDDDGRGEEPKEVVMAPVAPQEQRAESAPANLTTETAQAGGTSNPNPPQTQGSAVAPVVTEETFTSPPGVPHAEHSVQAATVTEGGSTQLFEQRAPVIPGFTPPATPETPGMTPTSPSAAPATPPAATVAVAPSVAPVTPQPAAASESNDPVIIHVAAGEERVRNWLLGKGIHPEHYPDIGSALSELIRQG
jgi:hypothetical protein